MENKLEVRDLRISFRTISGKLQAVRDISFDLKEGETLAIVGESGSGKSVTSKAILGILAGNSIVEGGEIIYDGMDLLKISEDEFYKIRGDKIAMIFQDTLSSLNPIMRIGKQLTEAMLLKGKARQKACKAAFGSYLALLKSYMTEAVAENDPARAAEIAQMCKTFDTFEFKHIALEQEYNNAVNAATEAIADIENILFLIEKNALKKETKRDLDEVISLSKKAISTYVVSGTDANTLTAACSEIKAKYSAAAVKGDYSEIADALCTIKDICEKAIAQEAPNFFSMGYYVTYAQDPMPSYPIPVLNSFLRKYLDEHFMLNFIKIGEIAIKKSAEKHDVEKRNVNAELKKVLDLLETMDDYTEAEKEIKALIEKVKASIDPLEIHKDSVAYTFESSILAAVDVCKKAKTGNGKAIRAYEKQKKKYDSYEKRRGRKPDWKLTPPAVIDEAIARENVRKVLKRLYDHYEAVLAASTSRDFHAEMIGAIDFLKYNASGIVDRVTRSIAKHRALKLMEEVGIPEPRKKYSQYPFELSGGQRQRIVIAIALAANPDILICDEPTTALDVTIQAQILELINRLKKERNLSIIFITHDLGVVANMADKIAVMYAGKIVEYGTSEDVFYSPAHPYTWALLSSMPDLDTTEKLEAIPGTPPILIYPPVGDAFADRNKYALKIDFEKQPPMFRISDTHSAATWLLHPDAPHVDPPKIVTERIARMMKVTGGADHE